MRRDRHREKGRDFYDITFLYGFTTPNSKLIEAITHEPLRDVYDAVLACCRLMTFSDLALDVEPFLLHAADVRRVTTFLPFIEEKFASAGEIAPKTTL